MGLATIDPHSQKEHTEIFTKSLSLVLIRLVVTEKTSKLTMYGHPDAVFGQLPDGQLAIHFFENFDVFKWLYLAYYWVYVH